MPKKFKIGDRVRYTALDDKAWQPKYNVTYTIRKIDKEDDWYYQLQEIYDIYGENWYIDDRFELVESKPTEKSFFDQKGIDMPEIRTGTQLTCKDGRGTKLNTGKKYTVMYIDYDGTDHVQKVSLRGMGKYYYNIERFEPFVIGIPGFFFSQEVV